LGHQSKPTRTKHHDDEDVYIRIHCKALKSRHEDDNEDCSFTYGMLDYDCEMKRFSTSWAIEATPQLEPRTRLRPTTYQLALHLCSYTTGKKGSDSSLHHTFAAAISIKNSPYRKISRRGINECDLDYCVLDVPPSFLLDEMFVVEVRLWEQPGPVWFPQLVGDPDLAQLYTNPVWADVTFLVQGRSFPAHKNILSIKAPALLLDMKETNEPIELTGIDSNTFDML
jgi:BTB/POZ domain